MPENISSQFNRVFAFPIETNRSVNTILDRDSIPSGVRWEGMHVYVSQAGEQKTYELRGGIGNDNWEPISDINIDVAVDIAFSETSTNPVQNQVITNGMYQRTQLQTSGQAQVHWDNLTNVPDLVEQSDLADYQLRSEKGQPNGYPSLDGNGQVPIAQLPTELVRLLGDWNADTNTPTLANGTGTQGDAYKVSVAGTTDFGDGPITFAVDDLVVYDGSVWEKITGGFAYQNLTFSGGDLSISNGNTVSLDSRYNTKTEITGLLADKADKATTINTGTWLQGGGDLSANRTFDFVPSVASWLNDSQGNPRIYIGSTTVSNLGVLFRASASGQEFQYRDASNGTVWAVGDDGVLNTGSVPWTRLTNVPNILTEEEVITQGINSNSGSIPTSGADLDTAGGTNVFYSAGSANQPPGGNAVIQTFEHSGGYKQQLAYRFDVGALKYRGYDVNTDTWTDWKINWDDNNLPDPAQMSDIPAPQTLTLGTLPGEIEISDGNSIQLPSLYRVNRLDAEEIMGIGLTPFAHTTGSTGYPQTTGFGLYQQRLNGIEETFQIWAPSNNDDVLYYKRGTNPFHAIASADKVVGFEGNEGYATLYSGDLDVLPPANAVYAIGSTSTNVPNGIGTPRSLFVFGARNSSDPQLTSDLLIGTEGAAFRNRTNGTWMVPMTRGNAGFGLSWNDTDNALDWGEYDDPNNYHFVDLDYMSNTDGIFSIGNINDSGQPHIRASIYSSNTERSVSIGTGVGPSGENGGLIVSTSSTNSEITITASDGSSSVILNLSASPVSNANFNLSSGNLGLSGNGNGVIYTAPNGNRYLHSVDNSGNPVYTLI